MAGEITQYSTGEYRRKKGQAGPEFGNIVHRVFTATPVEHSNASRYQRWAGRRSSFVSPKRTFVVSKAREHTVPVHPPCLLALPIQH